MTEALKQALAESIVSLTKLEQQHAQGVQQMNQLAEKVVGARAAQDALGKLFVNGGVLTLSEAFAEDHEGIKTLVQELDGKQAEGS